MHLRSALLVSTALVLAPAFMGGSLEAQDASPYIPVQDWTMPYVEHLIAAGVLEDPTPLTRPLRRADVVRALDAVDTLRLGTAVTATVRRLRAALEDDVRGPRVRVSGGLGVAAANYARRDPLSAIDSIGPRR